MQGGLGSVGKWLLAAIAFGAVAGTGSLALMPSGDKPLGDSIRPALIRAGLVRQRPPQPGDNWGGCNDARAAGTAPIYRGEPGYRDNMDGDGDGIACEAIG